MRTRLVAGWLALLLGGAAAAQRTTGLEQTYAAGQAAKAAGDLATARRELERVVASAPRHADAWWTLGWVYQGLREPGRARNAFGQAAQWLPASDPRRSQARARAAAPADGGLRPWRPVAPVEPRPLDTPLLPPWLLTVLASATAVAAAAALRAAWWQWQDGGGGPTGELVDLLRGLAAGDATAADRLLALSATLPEPAAADVAAGLTVAAAAQPAVRERLLAAVRGPGPRRLAAARALAGLPAAPDPELWPELAGSADPALRAVAQRALRPPPPPGVMTPDPAPVPDEAEAAESDLLAALDRGPAAEAAHAATLLRRRLAVAAIPALLRRSAQEGPEEVHAWAAAIALAAEEGAAPYLVTAATDPDPAVRRLGLELLADHPCPQGAAELLALLQVDGSPDWPLVRRAARAVAALHDQRALPLLRELYARRPAARCDEVDVALARLGDRDAAARVEAMLDRSAWADRRVAAEYFAELSNLSRRARAVVREAAAHRQAHAILDSDRALEPEVVAAELAALGVPVRPSLWEWVIAGHQRHLAAAGLAALGEAEAPAVARQLDRVDSLLAESDALQRHHAELATLAGGARPVRHYLRERLGRAELRALRRTAPAEDEDPHLATAESVAGAENRGG